MQIPFFQEMQSAGTVLLAGAGGGFDVYATLPLFFWLRRLGKKVHLASQSFSNLAACQGDRLGTSILVVNEKTRGASDYFPELALYQWLASVGHPVPIYTFGRGGVQGVANLYRKLAATLQPDAIVLVDGGTDILMRGDEPSLGTPCEDIASLLGVHLLGDVRRKFVVCVGFGIDTHHGVNHACVLENVAALIEDGGYLGAWSLCKGTEEADLYAAAVQHATDRYPLMPSIVNRSIVCATNGWFGDRHFTDRTAGSKLFLSPLMSLYWAFGMEALVSKLLYREQVLSTRDHFELYQAISNFRDGLPRFREGASIPY